MNILIVTRRFFPHGDATSAVVGNLAEALVPRGCNIKVIALTTEQEDADASRWKSCSVRNIYVPTWKQPERLKKELREDPFSAGWTIFSKAASRTYGKLVPAYRKLSLNPRLVDTYKKAVGQELRSGNYDLCIVTMIPQEAVCAVIQDCGKKTKTAMYQLDTYWNNLQFPEKYREARKEFEKKALRECAFSVVTPIIHETDKELFPELAHKIIPAEFPMVKPVPVSEGKKQEDGKTHCVFLGILYPELRPPEKVIACISKLGDRDVVFDFYGDRQDLIRNCPGYEENRDRIHLHGRVSSGEAEAVRAGADVLVNIDNTSLFQVPSKIFEYFSTGKPIINFYFDEMSPALDYFRRYPACLNINVNRADREEAARAVRDFLKRLGNQPVPFERVREQFRECTPEYVANQFLEALRT